MAKKGMNGSSSKKSLQQQLLELEDPTPNDFDPEDIQLTSTWKPSKSTASTTEKESSLPRSVGSSLRDISLMSGKYAGKPISRKQLQQLEDNNNNNNDDEGLGEDESDEYSEEDDLEDASDGSLDKDKIERKMDKLFSGLEYDSEGEEGEDGEEDRDEEGEDSEEDIDEENDGLNGFTMGGGLSDEDENEDQEDISEESDEEDEDEDMDDIANSAAAGKLVSGNKNAMDEADRLERELREREEEERSVVQSIAPQKTEEEKALHTKNQQYLWNQMLDSRIRIQGPLLSSNRLPQHDVYPVFLEDKSIKTLLEEVSQNVKLLLDDMLDLQDCLYNANPEIYQVGGVSSSTTKKRKISEIVSIDDVWNEVKERSDKFTRYQNETIDKWNQRTQLASGQNIGKQFKAVNQSVLSQINQLLENRERLIKKTQLKRTNIRNVAKKMKEEQQREEHDEEIFDDTDFYQQILKEVIESGAQDLSNTQYLMEKNKLRKHTKKDIDRRASKGRKIRYKVHDKLVGYMVPNDSSTYGKDNWNIELFANLFGRV